MKTSTIVIISILSVLIITGIIAAIIISNKRAKEELLNDPSLVNKDDIDSLIAQKEAEWYKNILLAQQVKQLQQQTPVVQQQPTTQITQEPLPSSVVYTQQPDLSTAKNPLICASKCSVLHPFNRNKKENCISDCKQS